MRSGKVLEEILDIIATTPHGFTHHAAVWAKHELMKFCRSYQQAYPLEEGFTFVERDTWEGDRWPRPVSHISLQFLIDYATNILYSWDIDVWEIITNPQEN